MKQTGMKPDGEKIDVEMPEVSRPACVNCAFAIAQVDGATNKVVAIECRRYAPRPGIIASWPGVSPEDWCGMYMSRPEFHANELAKKQAAGIMRLFGDMADDAKSPPENLNG